jgi:glycosyltransferase involved in cell wall biosynthesis
MAAGTPAVVAGAGSLSEVVGDAALVVDDPEDPHAWATALDQLSDARTRAAASERGSVHAAAFSWGATSERTVAVWRAVLAGRPPKEAAAVEAEDGVDR